MDATKVARANERNLELIIDTLAVLACQPAPTDAPSVGSSVDHDLTKQKQTRESYAPGGPAVPAPADGPLENASVSRLACLFRHWTWADEARARFEREPTQGWEYDEDLLADHPFGAYYHWCALLCGFTEAALEHGLLSGTQLAALRPDLEARLAQQGTQPTPRSNGLARIVASILSPELTAYGHEC
jgi:hypothetical protein